MTAAGLTAVSLFAGIGGFDLAMERAGVRVAAAVEIDPACRGVLRRRFPQAKVFNDVTEVTGEQLRAAGFVPGRGIITGGFPCQDLSVAGRRGGLGGARSGLFWEVVRLADELRPRWLLLENVPGLLSAVCPCPGDGACVANGRSVRCGEPGGEQPSAHQVRGGACAGGCIPAHGGAMGAVLGAVGKLGYGFAYRVLDAQFFGVPQRRRRVFIAGCLGDPCGPVEVLLEPEGGEGNPAEGREAREGTAGAPGGGAVATLQGGGRRGHRVDAEGAAGGHLIAFDAAQVTHPENRVNPQPGDPNPPLVATGQPMIAYSVTARESKGPDSKGTSGNIVAHALTSEGADASEDGTGRGTPLVTVTSLAVAGDFSSSDGIAQTVRSAHGQPGTISDATAVRRLTPLECERLQGFPDDWTRWLDDGSEQSDSARYRQCGNAVAVPVAEWIARRITAMDQASAEERAA